MEDRHIVQFEQDTRGKAGQALVVGDLEAEQLVARDQVAFHGHHAAPGLQREQLQAALLRIGAAQLAKELGMRGVGGERRALAALPAGRLER
jgi:hypothetical protein